MIKLTNTVLIGLISAGLLVGCGSDSDDGGTTPTTEVSDTESGTSPETDPNSPTDTDTPTTPPVTPPTTTSAKTFGADVMPVLVAQCQSCHGSNGNFTVTTASNTYSNIVALKGSAVAGGQYLLDKGAGTVGHGGGTVISTTTVEYATIKSWVDAGAANN